MAYTLIAPIGKNSKHLFTVLKDHHITSVILLCAKEYEGVASRVGRALQKVQISARVDVIATSLSESLLPLLKNRDNTFTLLHAGCADQDAAITTISAAYLFGIPVFAVQQNIVSELPLLRIKYNDIISGKKQDILKVIASKGVFSSLDLLAKEVNMSVPLVSYHIHGNAKSKGLEALGIVETRSENGYTKISLTKLGSSIV